MKSFTEFLEEATTRSGEFVSAAAPYRVQFELKNLKGTAWSKTGRSFDSKAEAQEFIKKNKENPKYRKMTGVLERGTHYEEVDIEEGYNDPVHRKYISDAVHDFVPKNDPRHDKIVDHLHKAKNFGTKTKDELETVGSISTGTAHRITKAVADSLKSNFGTPSKTQTQAQRVDTYLKQKWVKPR